MGTPRDSDENRAQEIVPMSKTISYRAVLIEKVTSAMLAGLLVGVTKLVVAIDVAKTKMAGFGREDGGVCPSRL